MIDWEAVALTFVAVTMNHMGLVAAVEKVVGRRLPIVGCVKCLTFWTTLSYGIYTSREVVHPVAMAFLYSYSALWLELLMGWVDSIYLKCYEKIVSNTGAGQAPADPDKGDTAGPVS